MCEERAIEPCVWPGRNQDHRGQCGDERIPARISELMVVEHNAGQHRTSGANSQSGGEMCGNE